jgi:hypothetical protein
MTDKIPRGVKTTQEKWRDEAGDEERVSLEVLTEELLDAKRQLCSELQALIEGEEWDEVDGAFLPIAKYVIDNSALLRVSDQDLKDIKGAVVQYRNRYRKYICVDDE